MSKENKEINQAESTDIQKPKNNADKIDNASKVDNIGEPPHLVLIKDEQFIEDEKEISQSTESIKLDSVDKPHNNSKEKNNHKDEALSKNEISNKDGIPSNENKSNQKREKSNIDDNLAKVDFSRRYDDIPLESIDLERLEQMSDDEAVIELDKMTGQNDELVEKDYLSALINQDDRLIYYEVENIYHDPQKRVFRNRFKMRKDPPVLVVRDDFGNEAKFYLTENLTDELSETLRQVKRAYYGFNGPSDLNMPEKFIDKVKYYVKNNIFKLSVTVFMILFILFLSL